MQTKSTSKVDVTHWPIWLYYSTWIKVLSTPSVFVTNQVLSSHHQSPERQGIKQFPVKCLIGNYPFFKGTTWSGTSQNWNASVPPVFIEHLLPKSNQPKKNMLWILMCSFLSGICSWVWRWRALWKWSKPLSGFHSKWKQY